MARRSYPPAPSHVRVTPKRDYEVVRITEFKDPTTLGECRWEPPQIVLREGQTPKEELSTFVHELLHAVSNEYNANLTEAQVLAMEKGLLKVLLLNKWI